MKKQEGLPKYNTSRQKGEIGVSLFKLCVEENLGWIFRRNYQEFDFGIDGYIDLITENGYVSGKSIAVQIKYGKSFFRESNEIGWVFRGEKKHLNYLMNFEIPVLICLINPNTRLVYWVLFEFTETSKAGDNWVITVPFKQVLDENSKQELESMTGEVTNYIPQFENYWRESKQFEEQKSIIILTGRDDIENLNAEPFVQFFQLLESNKKLILSMRNKVNFLIEGYDNDSRELCEIQEVRQWMSEVLHRIDSWGYFLNMEDDYSGLHILHSCTNKILEVKPMGDTYQVFIVKEGIKKTLNVIFNGLNEFCDRNGISDEITKIQSKKIIELLRPHGGK